MSDSQYETGKRYVTRSTMIGLLKYLPADDSLKTHCELRLELDESKASLRELSNTFKFEEWDDNLYLPDAIDQLSKWMGEP